MTVDNIVSIQRPREASRMRRLIGPPFSRKFLLDREDIFKQCAERTIKRIEESRALNEGPVEVSMEFRRFTLDVVSM